MKKLILYGASSIGRLAKQTVEELGYNVVGFIDKRADEISSYMGLPVWKLEDVPTECKDAAIFVSVKNVFEHEKIALKLRQYFGSTKKLVSKNAIKP